MRNKTIMIVGLPLLAGAMCAAHAGILARYDANAGSPGSAAEIQSPVAQGWDESGTGGGVAVGGVVDGETNGWRISDDASGLNAAYVASLSEAELMQMYQNGWVFEMVVRAVRGEPVTGFCGWGVTTGSDPGWGLSERERVGFSVELVAASGAFQVTPTHGGTITLSPASGAGFHTIRCVGLPFSPLYEFFLDGVSLGTFDIRDGSSNSNYDDVVRFASGSTSGTGREASWHSVQLSVGEPALIVVMSNGFTEVSEEGATYDTYSLSLSRPPTADVVVTVQPDGASRDIDVGAGPGRSFDLVFTPARWNVAQQVSVKAVDDDYEEMTQQVIVRHTAASSDPFFDGKTVGVVVTVLDNDVSEPQLDVVTSVFVSPRGSFVSDPNLYHTFRIPSMIVAPDGSLLAFAEGRRGTGSDPRTQANAPIDIVMKRSTNLGASWSPREVIDCGFQTNGWLVDFADPTTVVDKTTVPPALILFYGQWEDRGAISPTPGNDPDPAEHNQVIWVRTSTNGGVAWSERTQVLKPVGPADSPDGLYWRMGEPGPGNGIQLQWQEGPNAALNGRLVIPAKRNGSSTPEGPVATEPFMYYSDDHGATWQIGNVTPGPDANEDEVVELSNGRVLLDARQNSGGNRRRHLSSDGGVNWGANLGDDVTITAVDCSLDRYSARRDGDDRDRILFSGPAGRPAGSGSGRYNLTVWTSYDEGRSFINPVQINEAAAAYSVVRTLPDGSIGVLAETDDYGKIKFFGLGLHFLEGMTHPVELTHYDGFGNKIDRARGGTGWSGPWSAGATFSGTYAPEFGSASVGFDDFDRPRLFGRLDLVNGQSTERTLSRPIDLGSDGRAYMSLLVSRQLDSSANTADDEELRIEFREGSGTVCAAFGIDSQEAFFLDELGARQEGAANAFALTNSYLLVLKIVAKASGADQLFLKAYPSGSFGSGSVESDLGWTLVGGIGENSDAVLERIALLGGAGAVWSVDEIRLGESWRSVAGEDVDADHLDDAWEIKYFGNLMSSDGSGDADRDGMTDAQEQTAGTHPLNPASCFQALLQEINGGFGLTWPSAEGRSYRVLGRPDMAGGGWTVVGAGIAATPPVNVFPLILMEKAMFYRVLVE